MIEIKNLIKNYDNTSIKYNDYKIEKGDFVSIIGPSGSGKSTLIDLIGNFITYSSGHIYIFDKEISQFRKKEKNILIKRLGIMSSNSLLLSDLSVIENIKLPQLIHKNQIEERHMSYLINKLNIENLLLKYPMSLSTGQRQRVLLARAMILKPDILIADEPTSNLDSENTNNLIKCLVNLNDELKTTIIVATHDKVVSNASKRIFQLR
tara:strand:+ start:1073 stop:1696 length:624 start_codon:yes stop_codon:yes gene_type:complete